MKASKPTAEVTSSPAPPQRDYQLINLELSDYMPIVFDGRAYNLADLSEDEVTYLLGFPDQVPYLKKLDVSQASV